MKKLLLATLLFTTTSAFALPAMNFGYYSKDSGNILNFSHKDYVDAYDGTKTCAIGGTGKLVQKSDKSFVVLDVDGYSGQGCENTSVKTFNGVVLATKNNKVTKFRINGNHYFSGTYTISQ